MFKKKNDGNGEKIFRYSIRKYHFGAASVAVAALMFFANGVQAQAPAVSSATASDVVAGSAGTPDKDKQESDGEEPEKVSHTEPSAELQSTGESNSPETKTEDASKGQETAGLAPTKPETKPAAQEAPQVGEVKEQDQPTSATKTTEAKSLQGNLQALLEKLTLSSMKALHDEVESRLAAAKAVLENPKATQAQVDEQVRAMEELTSRVNQALSPQVSTPPVLEKAGLTNTRPAAPEGTVLTPKEAVTKVLEENHVSSTNGEVSTPSTELSKPEVSDNQNKDKLKTLSRDLSAYLIQANEITRPETKKLLEGVEEVVKSIEASVSQPQLTPTEIEELLKKGKQAEKKLFLAISRENSGKRDLLNGKPMKQGSYLRATPEALNTKRAYIVRKGDGIDLPAETYLYALKRRQTDKPTDGNLVPVSDAVDEAKVTVENLGNGNFKWNLTFNSKQKTHQNAFYWFTLPTGHTITQTLAVTRINGAHAKSHIVGRNSFNTEWGESIKNTLGGNLATYGPASGKDGGFNTNFSSIHDVTNTDFIARSGSAQRTGAQPIDSRGSSGYYYLGPLQDRFRRWHPSTAVSQEFYKKSEKIIDGLKQNTNLLYHFTLNDGKVQISYMTHTDTPYAPIYYGAGMRSLEYNEALMYFMARGLQEKPNAPTVKTNNEGTVTVTPYSNQNQNVDKVELSYMNAGGESKTATLTRNPQTGTWLSNDAGIEVSQNSFIVKKGAVKAGTQVTAKSYFGNSDPSDIAISAKLVSSTTPTFTVGQQNPKTGAVTVTVGGVGNGSRVTLPGVTGEKTVANGKVELTNDDLPTTANTGKGSAQETGKLPTASASNITIPGKLTSAKGEPAREFEVTIPLPIVVPDPEHLTPEEKTELEKKVKKSNPNMDVKVDDKGNVTVTEPKTGQSKVIPVKDLTVKDFTPVKPTEKVPVKDKSHLTPEEKKQVADKVKAKNPGKEVTVGDDGTATVTDPTTGISHTIPGTDLVNQDFEPVKPTEKVPVKDKAHLTPEEKKQVADKVKDKNPGKEVTVGDDGTATVTDPTTGISHTIPGSELVNQVPNNGDNSSNDEKPDQGMVPRPNPTSTPRPDSGANTDNSANTNNGGTSTPADSNSNSVTPDNSGNTPAHSGDSTNQAAGQSTQQREAGNSTRPESPQGISEGSVTAPARSRRSVAFAGGSQSSQEKQVDKSVLRDLIRDLETRLKDLDGIDQSVIDAAKVILGEGQEALRNTDLTEAGLKEITAKVKEALESLKGKQATKDEEETKETRKEQGHLPYGTMIASLLALLGLLLFLIARRKKESELKKLTKELTKVLQESDLTSVDVKVLDQARETLAQAVAFLANEKESDHTEDELIEKLKAILAQLR